MTAKSYVKASTTSNYIALSTTWFDAFYTAATSTACSIYQYAANDNGDSTLDGLYYTSNSMTDHKPTGTLVTGGYYSSASKNYSTYYNYNTLIDVYENGELLCQIQADGVYWYNDNDFRIEQFMLSFSNGDVYSAESADYSEKVHTYTIQDLIDNPIDYGLSLE